MEIIEKIRKEIERRYNKHKYATAITEMVYAEEDESILAFLDSLEAEASYDTQKYAPTPSVDIGDVARVQFASHAKVLDKKRKAVFDWEQFKEVAGIFYGFGKKDHPEAEEKSPVEILAEKCPQEEIDPKIAQCIADHWWEMAGEEKETPINLDDEIVEYWKVMEWSKSIPLGKFKVIARYFYGLGQLNSK